MNRPESSILSRTENERHGGRDVSVHAEPADRWQGGRGLGSGKDDVQVASPDRLAVELGALEHFVRRVIGVRRPRLAVGRMFEAIAVRPGGKLDEQLTATDVADLAQFQLPPLSRFAGGSYPTRGEDTIHGGRRLSVAKRAADGRRCGRGSTESQIDFFGRRGLAWEGGNGVGSGVFSLSLLAESEIVPGGVPIDRKITVAWYCHRETETRPRQNTSNRLRFRCQRSDSFHTKYSRKDVSTGTELASGGKRKLNTPGQDPFVRSTLRAVPAKGSSQVPFSRISHS